MVERYFLEPMKTLWSVEAQYRRWLKVEIAVVKAYEELGVAPEGTSDKIEQKVVIDVEDILRIEQEVDHDVIAFIKSATKNIGDEARFFHYGLTSSDVVDTALSLALVESADYIIKELENLNSILYQKALKYKNLPTIGRTHGVHAEPTSFGLKFLSWYSEGLRNLKRLKAVREEIAVGKLSGAVGNYANIDPVVEEKALGYLGLKPVEVATQVVPRDYIANYLNILALIGAMIERIAVEIRHLQKTEVLEVFEPFKKGQRGSSAMPHKKNPILAERLTGMARLLRSYAHASLEDIALWHERDISHSSVERYILPDATSTAYYMLKKCQYLVGDLVVNEQKVIENIDKTKGLVFSQRGLLKLVEMGLSREEAYKLVQKTALECWETGKSFKEEILKVEFLKDIDPNELFSVDYYLRNVETIYNKFEK